MDGWVRVLRPFNSISVISRQWKDEHERLCAMKRCLGSGRISPSAGFEPATPWSKVGSTNRSAMRTLLVHVGTKFQPSRPHSSWEKCDKKILMFENRRKKKWEKKKKFLRYLADKFKMLKFSKGRNSGKIRWIVFVKFNKVIYSSFPISWSSFKPLAQICFEISCWQVKKCPNFQRSTTPEK